MAEYAIKVSVIIPIFNTGRYLSECLDSTLKQTIPNIEIICIDDGSTDGSPAILAEFAAKHSDILKVIRQRNMGVAAARNAGLDIAHGKYVCFLDSDDWIEPNMLENLCRRMDDADLELLYFEAEAFCESDVTSEELKSRKNAYRRSHHYAKIAAGPELFCEMYNNGEFYVMCTIVLYRRSWLVEHKIRFFEGMVHEDDLFSMICVINAQRCSVLNEAYYHRRYRKGSIMVSIMEDHSMLFESAMGYCQCIVQVMQLLTVHSYSRIIENAFASIIEAWFILAHTRISAVSGDELERKSALLSLHDRTMLQLLLHSCDNEKLIQDLRRDNARQKGTNMMLADEVKNVANSYSYKIGCVITWMPRKFRGGFHCCQEHGVWYTCILAFKKITRIFCV